MEIEIKSIQIKQIIGSCDSRIRLYSNPRHGIIFITPCYHQNCFNIVWNNAEILWQGLFIRVYEGRSSIFPHVLGFGILKGNCAHKNSTSHRQLEQKSLAYIIICGFCSFACINRSGVNFFFFYHLSSSTKNLPASLLS